MSTAQNSGRVKWWAAAGGALVAAAAGVALTFAGWGGPVREVHAQQVPPPAASGIAIISDGEAKAQPDTATVRLGVQVTAPTPAEALAQMRQATEALLQRLRSAGVPDANVQTTNLNVFPVYGTPQPGGGEPPITGYRGTATVTVTGQDIARASALLDAAVQAGATSVQGLTFDFRDPSQLQRDALAQAVTNARPKAEAAARAAGLTLGAVRSVQELSFGGPPEPVPFGRGSAGGGAGGVAPGELTVTVRAQVTFDVSR
jgi:uncharacterized protein YggE